MASTIFLDAKTWDLVVDASGNIARADQPYSLAQDAASAIKTFLGEVYYNTALGIPYLTQFFGKRPSLALMKATFTAAAESVPGVASATCVITALSNRAVTGQVQVKSATTGQVSVATFTVVNPQGAG